jgi:outer membrane scaffolding protein for murein synthesis (MipA/OmpV family)
MKKLLLITLCSLSLHTSELDLGMGAGVMFYPDYLGSDHTNALYIPFPYISYVSEDLEIDGSGVKAELFDINNLSLRLSLSGSVPVKSSGIREGMYDLDPSVEIGPALVYTLYDKEGLSLKIDAPIRAIISSDFKGADYRGYIYDPKLSIEYDFWDGYHFQLHTGGVFADSRYHNYLYGVKLRHSKKGRAYYKTDAGYSGYKTSMGIEKKFKNLWLGTFVRHYNLTGSIFRSSPLTVKNSAIYGGLFIAYLFDKSYTDRIKNWIEN